MNRELWPGQFGCQCRRFRTLASSPLKFGEARLEYRLKRFETPDGRPAEPSNFSQVPPDLSTECRKSVLQSAGVLQAGFAG